MSRTVIVGDTSEDLSHFAKIHDENAKLWSQDSQSTQTTYISIGDVGINTFLKILLAADHIIYHNKSSSWCDKETKELTDNIIYLLGLNGLAYKISGFQINSFVLEKNLLWKHLLDSELAGQLLIQKICNYSEDNFLGLVNHRKSMDKQIWVAGCSYAQGSGIESPNERYGELVAKQLGWQTTNIGRQGSSIDFAADQIMRSMVRAGDLIIWGLTGTYRYTWFDHGQIENVLLHHIDNKVQLKHRKKFLSQMLLDDARLYLAQRHVTQVQEFCNRVGCNLVLIYHDPLNFKSHVPIMKSFLHQYPGFLDINKIMIDQFGVGNLDEKYQLDIGADGMHPGAKTHAAWAKILVDFINSHKYAG